MEEGKRELVSGCKNTEQEKSVRENALVFQMEEITRRETDNKKEEKPKHVSEVRLADSRLR